MIYLDRRESLAALCGLITPNDLCAYLKKNGWAEIKMKNNHLKVFHHDCISNNHGYGFYQVKVPLDKGFADYEKAMENAITTAAIVRAHLDLLWDINHREEKEHA